MSTYAIGDIHGCFTSLKAIFSNLEYTQQDTFIIMGDMIDRGPDSKEVVNFIIDLKEKATVICLKGNHEVMILESINGNFNIQKAWLTCGGFNTLDSYGVNNTYWEQFIPDKHWDFFRSLKDYYETEHYIFVHAGLEEYTPLEQQDEEHLLWLHLNEPIHPHFSGKTVVVGHTPLRGGIVYDYGHTIMVDTLSFAGGWVTCFDLEEKIAHQGNMEGEYRRTLPEVRKNS